MTKIRSKLPQRLQAEAKARRLLLMICAECANIWTTTEKPKLCPVCKSADIGEQLPLGAIR